MVWSDGTSHGRINHQLFEYFRPDVLADLEDAIEAAAHAQLDAALADGDTFDFASEFAVPVPLRVVMDLVGVPREDLFGRLDEYDLDALLEEVLRHRSPLQSRVRETAAPVTLAGVDVPAGETVVLWLGAANRDPARYDDPDAFRPGRDPDHLAFGSGAHVCIGAPLARLEGPVVVRVLRERLADIDVHDDGLVPKSKASKLGFERLPVTVTHTVGCNCLPVIRRIFGRIPEMTYNRPYQA
jgi:cytochrome P450